MRRAERKITDPALIADIISRTQTAHIAFLREGAPAIVPMTFGCEAADGSFVFYFHGAREGSKVDAWRLDPRVVIEITGADEIICGTPACKSTTKFASVIAEGKIEFATDPDVMRRGLDVIMAQCNCPGPHDYPEKMLAITAVFKVKAQTISAKSNISSYTDLPSKGS